MRIAAVGHVGCVLKTIWRPTFFPHGSVFKTKRTVHINAGLVANFNIFHYYCY
jgi:hypothetical protein